MCSCCRLRLLGHQVGEGLGGRKVVRGRGLGLDIRRRWRRRWRGWRLGGRGGALGGARGRMLRRLGQRGRRDVGGGRWRRRGLIEVERAGGLGVGGGRLVGGGRSRRGSGRGSLGLDEARRLLVAGVAQARGRRGRGAGGLLGAGLARPRGRRLAEQVARGEGVGSIARPEGRVLEAAHLFLPGAVLALQVEVVANCVVKNAHRAPIRGVEFESLEAWSKFDTHRCCGFCIVATRHARSLSHSRCGPGPCRRASHAAAPGRRPR